jgi:hypothetical protein
MSWRVGTPALSLSTGTSIGVQEVVVMEATPGATMPYTLTGVDPTGSDPVVVSRASIAVTAADTEGRRLEDRITAEEHRECDLYAQRSRPGGDSGLWYLQGAALRHGHGRGGQRDDSLHGEWRNADAEAIHLLVCSCIILVIAGRRCMGDGLREARE